MHEVQASCRILAGLQLSGMQWFFPSHWRASEKLPSDKTTSGDHRLCCSLSFLRLSIISTPSSSLSECVVGKVLRLNPVNWGTPLVELARGAHAGSRCNSKVEEDPVRAEVGFWLERKLYIVDYIAMDPCSFRF